MIKITQNGSKLTLSAPYHPDFAPKAKRIGGRWDASTKVWTFDARDRDRLANICRDVYGTDGSEPAGDVLTIRAPVTICDGRQGTLGGSRPTSWWLAGREIARARGRDSGATLGDGVVVIRGGFGSGGSVKNPACTFRDGTIFEVRDVPRAAAERVHAEYHGVTLLDATGNVVAEATHEEEPSPETPPPSEADRLAIEIAAAEGRLAGLRFRAAEVQS